MRNDMSFDKKLIVLVWKYGPATLSGDANELDKASRSTTTDRSKNADLSFRKGLALRLKEFHHEEWIPVHSMNWMSWANCLITECSQHNLKVEDEIKNDCPETCLHLFNRPAEVAAQASNITKLQQQTKTCERMFTALRAEALRTYREQVRIFDAYSNLMQGVHEDLWSFSCSCFCSFYC
jgi:hypothetical protein